MPSRTARRQTPKPKSPTSKAKAGKRPAKPRSSRAASVAYAGLPPAGAPAARPPTRAERLAAANLAPGPGIEAVRPKRPFYGNSRTDPGPGKTMRMAVLGMVAVAVVIASLAAAQVIAQDGAGNSGTIKVHDGAAAEPPQRNEPHVEGDAFVEGFNMAADEGTLEIYSWPPTGNQELVLATTWEADGGEPESHFLAGPFTLPCGHYRVEAQNGMEEDDFPGGKKSKMFWVECPEGEPPCGEPGGEPCPEPCEPGDEDCPIPCGEPGGEPCPEPPCGEPGGEPCPVEMTCPADLAVVANPDGTITLTWMDAEGSDGTNVYRAIGDGDFEYVATVAPGVQTYTDADTGVGQGYAYTVTGLYGNQESTDCPLSEVTAIPEFPTVVGFGLASAGGLAALVFAGRRRKA